MRLAALALLLSACGVPQPSNPEVDAPPGADEAAALVVDEWSARLDMSLSVAELPPVLWFEGPCLDYGDDGGLRCTLGGYAEHPLHEPEIHVVALPAIHESKLAHETLHWALDSASGDSDQDHEGSEWLQVPDVERSLAEAGY